MKNNILFILSIVLTLFSCQKDDNQNIDENKDVILNGRIKFSSNNNIPQNLKVLSLDGKTDIISNTFLGLPTSANGLEFLLDENDSVIFIRKNYVTYVDDMLSSKSTTLFLTTFNTHFYSLNDVEKNIIINQILEHSKFFEAVSKLDSLPSINLSNQSFKESIYELISEIFSEENLNNIGRWNSSDTPLVDISYNDNPNVVVVKNNTSNHIGYSIRKDNLQIDFNLISGNATMTFPLNDLNINYDLKMMSGADISGVFANNQLEEIEAFNADFHDFLYEATQILLQLIVPNLNDACLETIFNSLINGINFAENYGNNNSPTDALNNAFEDIQESLPSMLEGAFGCIEVDNGILGEILEILNVVTDLIKISNFLNKTAITITEYYAYENLVEKCFIFNGIGIIECQDLVLSAHTPSPTDNATDIAINGNLSFSEGANTPVDATYKLYLGTTSNPNNVFPLSSGVTTSPYSNALNGTTYFWKVETISNSGSVLATSPVWNFTTISNTNIPTVTTTTITNITQTTAISGGNVADDGGSNVTVKGVVWSTSQNPTITDNLTNDGTGTGSFTSNMTGLTENTTYYVRAYATNSVGTAYGNEEVFTTLSNTNIPTVTTTTITNITQTTAISGGNVTDEGGSNVTTKGVVWSTSPNPTITDNLTTDDTGAGSFTSNMTGLTENTTYYVRAYATNSVGTAYGNEEVFTTQNSNSGNVYDGDYLITNQQNIDDFNNQGYTGITGDLDIILSNNITNLQGLESLITLGGNLFIDDNSNLTSLLGLDYVENIGGFVYIANNNLLNNIGSLNNLNSIGNYIQFRSNSSLVVIDGFNSLTIIGGELLIYFNNSLLNINGFNNLTNIDGNINIGVNDSLVNLDGLSNLNQLTGNIYIGYSPTNTNVPNSNLSDFCGLTNLLVNGDFSGTYNVSNNAYNPTQQDIIDGNCSQ